MKRRIHRETTEDLWAAFKDHQDMAARDELVRRYWPLAEKIGRGIAKTMPKTSDTDDIPSFAHLGLLDAVNKYSPERGVWFETYASRRIRGSIYDELRKVDWVPRRIRSQTKELQSTFASMELNLGHSPTEAEVQEELGWSDEEMRDATSHVQWAKLSSLQSGWDDTGTTETGTGDKYQQSAYSFDDDAIDPEQDLDPDEIDAVLDPVVDAIAALPERERIVFTLYYYSGLTFGDIGNQLGISESRVCQLHTHGIEALRESMG